MQNLDLQQITQYVKDMPADDFRWLYRRISRHQSFLICSSAGAAMMTEAEMLDLHKFLCEHGFPVFKEIRESELKCAATAIHTRANAMQL